MKKPGTILLLAPLKSELKFFLKSSQSQNIPYEEVNIGIINAYRLHPLNAILAVGGHGKTQFAIHTRYILDRVKNVDLVMCIGAAGALAGHLKVGDVVIAETTVEHDFTMRFDIRPLPRFNGHAKTVQSLSLLSSNVKEFTIHTGIIASGDEDVIDHHRSSEIKAKTNGLAVAWEGVGGARACAFSNTPFVEIRGITDTANHDAMADFATHLERAVNNIAMVIFTWMKMNT
ncbi:MAG: 5'-methylthioadenosine/S-adenosylhomocysteine nucleosidase [Chitinivibrionales bacterium]|nr:5'-methylthioadenosine/S-adenosylhomocysteine nucleosidase [Chitinivibrionales bacterium]